MPARTLDPLVIPAEFWRRDDVLTALRSQDVGSLFRLLRQRFGASQTRIGIAVGMPQSQVSVIMSGVRSRKVTALDVFVRIADGLGMPDDARRSFGLAPRSYEATAGTTGGRGMCAADAAEPWALTEVLTRLSMSPQMMDHLERAVLTQASEYSSTPPIEMWPVVRQQLARTKQALSNRQTWQVQRRLVRSIGVLAGLAGNLLIDLGARARAGEYFHLARLAGEEAEDRDLVAWALALHSIDPYFWGNLRDACNLLDKADELAAAGSSARRRAWIAALRARAYAARPGFQHQAMAALSDSYAAIEKADTVQGTDFFDRDRLDGIAGTTHLLLRDTGRAFDLIVRAVDQRPSSDAKGRALLTLDKAACRLIDQEPARATAYVHEALDLAGDQLVRPILVRVRHVRAGMRPWQRLRTVATLDDRLRSIIGSPAKGA